MGIPKDQKPAEKFKATPQRKITKEMFLARSFTVQPLAVTLPGPKRAPDLMDTFRDMVIGRETQQMFANMAFTPQPRKSWTLADIMPVQNFQEDFFKRNPGQPVQHVPSHTSRLFRPDALREMAGTVARICDEERLDALLCCGHSGIILASAASFVCGIPIFVARKPSEQPVAGSQGLRINGIAPHGPAKRWAWIDDHISSGGTFDRSRKLALEARLIATTIPTLILLYEGDGRYYMTEDKYLGYRQGWESDEVAQGQVLIRATRI